MQQSANDRNPVKDLFGADEVIDSGSDGVCAAHEIVASLGRYGIFNLGYDGEHGRNPGYLFRGEADFPCPLQCSVERDWRDDQKSGETFTADELKAKEKTLLKDYLEHEGPRLACIVDPQCGQKSWDEIWWWLSLMQHYERHTRLVDFTRDIRLALYFAVEQHEKRLKKRQCLDLIVYCFPCRDLNHPHDADGNKCPWLPNPEIPAVDMNLAIGCLIDLDWMKRHKPSWFKDDGSPMHWSRNDTQRWGWDRPYYKNPRIDFQKGMFVYPYDYPEQTDPLSKADNASWLVKNLYRSARESGNPFNSKESSAELPAKRIRIPSKHASALKDFLRDRFLLTAATVYLDYNRNDNVAR